jgi:hypothetical protein
MIKILHYTATVLSICLILSGLSWAEEYSESNNDQRIYEGKVVAVNLSKPSLTVKGVEEIEFPISADTNIKSDINDIKLSDINVGDYVTVDYIRFGSQSRVPSKVSNVTVEYRGK